jgi:PIN domain nuclease of toxin-antitoxin system
VIQTGAAAVFVSAATVWEIEIKRALGRLKAPEDVAGLVTEAGFEPLAISFEHARQAGRLPQLHGDPFDRMLVAQALAEGMTLATADADIRRYEVPVLAVTRI